MTVKPAVTAAMAVPVVRVELAVLAA